MKVLQGTVATNIDFNKTGNLKVKFKGLGERDVTFLSPHSHRNAGFFSPPTKGSTVYVLEVEEGDTESDPSLNLLYLGSVVGVSNSEGRSQDERKLNRDFSESPEKAAKASDLEPDEGYTVDETSLGERTKSTMNIPREALKAYDGKGIVAEKQVWEDPGGNAVVLSHQTGYGKDEGFQDISLELKTGSGKYLKFSDSPAANMIEMCPDKQQINTLVFAGSQTGPRADKHTFQNGEFRLNTLGPVNLESRQSSMSFVVDDGYNIDITNNSTDWLAWGNHSLNKTKRGGSHPTHSAVNGTYLHPGAGTPTGAGDATDLGGTQTGCVNLTSKHNNITINALAEDSVVYINTPGQESKVTIISGGSVDIIAEGPLSLGSREIVAINAPVVDINGSPYGVYIN